MAFLDPKDVILLFNGTQVDCEVVGGFEVTREIEEIICKQNAPGGAVKLGRISGSMTFQTIASDDDTNNGFELLQDLIDGTEAVALFQGPTGSKAVQFPAAVITSVSGESDVTGSTVTFTGTITLSGTPAVINV